MWYTDARLHVEHKCNVDGTTSMNWRLTFSPSGQRLAVPSTRCACSTVLQEMHACETFSCNMQPFVKENFKLWVAINQHVCNLILSEKPSDNLRIIQECGPRRNRWNFIETCINRSYKKFNKEWKTRIYVRCRLIRRKKVMQIRVDIMMKIKSSWLMYILEKSRSFRYSSTQEIVKQVIELIYIL